MRQLVMIARDTCFSPHSQENDQAVFNEVRRRMEDMGFNVTVVVEDAGGTTLLALDDTHTQGFLSMGRHPATLEYLRQQERRGRMVINSPLGVALCVRRCRLDALMRENGFAVAPFVGNDGYWIKRGDTTAMSEGDVAFAEDEEVCKCITREWRQRGVAEVLVTAHVRGDVVKFYGVQGTGFFRCYYPSDDGMTKFGDERRNGAAQHYPFDRERMRGEAERLAQMLCTPVYGGDAIVDADGRFVFVDFNDWPSFARCRDEAAQAIATLAVNQMEEML